MMEQISRKTGNVADFLLKLDIQLFADEDGGNTPELEDSPEFKEDLKEFSQFEQKMEKFAEERKAKETETVKETPAEKTTENEPVKESKEAATPEVAAPEDKPKQDSETNKAFQEMRQKLAAAETQRAEAEALSKKADSLIAQQYGDSHGVYTVAQYEQRLQQEKEAENNERYKTAGLTPAEIEKLKDYDRIQQETSQENQTKHQQTIKSQWDEVFSSFPDIEKRGIAFNGSQVVIEGDNAPSWLTPDMLSMLESGYKPLAAYRNAHFETILANATKGTKEVAKQEALNQLSSKDHIKPNGSMGGDVDHVEIAPEQMKIFRALNKGKSDAEIRKFYKKQTAGG